MNNLVPVSAPKVPRELAWLFQASPVLSDEQKSIYNDLVASISTAIQPEDGIVWTLVKEWVELSLEIHQCRLFKADIIIMTRKDALANMLASFLAKEDIPAGSDCMQRAQEWAEEWFADPSRRLAIKKMLHRHDLTPRAIDPNWRARAVENRNARGVDLRRHEFSDPWQTEARRPGDGAQRWLIGIIEYAISR